MNFFRPFKTKVLVKTGTNKAYDRLCDNPTQLIKIVLRFSWSGTSYPQLQVHKIYGTCSLTNLDCLENRAVRDRLTGVRYCRLPKGIRRKRKSRCPYYRKL